MITIGNCCCVFSLRTGTLFIGWILLFLSVAATINGITIPLISDNNTQDETDRLKYWLSLFLTLIHVLAAILLLVGVYKKKKEFVFFFLLAYTVSAIVNIFLIIAIFIAIHQGVSNTLLLVMLAGSIFLVALYLYSLLVIFSFYREMSSGLTP